jgi:hypothetical protein
MFQKSLKFKKGLMLQILSIGQCFEWIPISIFLKWVDSLIAPKFKYDLIVWIGLIFEIYWLPWKGWSSKEYHYLKKDQIGIILNYPNGKCLEDPWYAFFLNTFMPHYFKVAQTLGRGRWAHVLRYSNGLVDEFEVAKVLKWIDIQKGFDALDCSKVQKRINNLSSNCSITLV